MEKTTHASNLKICNFIFFVVIFCFGVYLFYSQVYGKLQSDMHPHIAYIDMSFTGISKEQKMIFDHSIEDDIQRLYVLSQPSLRQIIINDVVVEKLKFLNLSYSMQPRVDHNVFLTHLEKIRLPEVGFEDTVYLLANLFDLSYGVVSVFLLAMAFVSATYILLFLLRKFLDLTDGYLLLFTLFLTIVSAIYDPLFNKWVCLGQGCANVWHNPTFFMVKSFSLMCVYFSVKQLQTFKKSMWLCSSMLLLASLFYKPSFGIVFIPAYAIYILLFYTRNFRAYFYSLLMVLPSLAYALFYQLPRLLHYIPNEGRNSSIYFAPFKFIHYYSHNAFISFLLGMAFPLFFLILNYKKVLANRYLVFSWIMLLVGYFQYAFLVEGKVNWQDGNFSWGYYLTLDVLFIFSFIELVKQLLIYKMSNKFERIKMLILSALFFLHVFSGFFYLIKYFVTNVSM